MNYVPKNELKLGRLTRSIFKLKNYGKCFGYEWIVVGDHESFY
jgi:hypothetical protein